MLLRLVCNTGDAGRVCAPTVGCLGTSSSCSIAGACCSLACVAKQDGVGACGDSPVCAPVGAACTRRSDCCSDDCPAGSCVASSAPCKPAGETCGGPGECCGQVCNPGPGGARRCALLEGCRVQGEICTTSADCCTDVCVLDAQSVGHCAALATCTENDHQTCMRSDRRDLRRERRLLFAILPATARRTEALRFIAGVPARSASSARRTPIAARVCARASTTSSRAASLRRRTAARTERCAAATATAAPRPRACRIRLRRARSDATRRRAMARAGRTVCRVPSQPNAAAGRCDPSQDGGLRVRLVVRGRRWQLHVERRLLRRLAAVPAWSNGVLVCARSAP